MGNSVRDGLMVQAKKEFGEEGNKNMERMGWIGRKASEMWKALSDADKAPFESKAKEDKERYVKEIEQFEKDHPEELAAHKKGRSAKTKAKRKAIFHGTGAREFKKKFDELAVKFEVPKKPMMAHMLFCNEVRKGVMEENPGKPIGAYMGIMMEKYKALDAAGKKKYEDQAAELKKKHEEAMKEYVDSGRKADYDKAVEELKGSRKEDLAKEKEKKKGPKKSKTKKTKKTTKKKGDKKKKKDDSDSDDEDDDDDDESEESEKPKKKEKAKAKTTTKPKEKEKKKKDESDDDDSDDSDDSDKKKKKKKEKKKKKKKEKKENKEKKDKKEKKRKAESSDSEDEPPKKKKKE